MKDADGPYPDQSVVNLDPLNAHMKAKDLMTNGPTGIDIQMRTIGYATEETLLAIQKASPGVGISPSKEAGPLISPVQWMLVYPDGSQAIAGLVADAILTKAGYTKQGMWWDVGVDLIYKK